MAPVSVTCFMPRLSTISAGSPPSLKTISNRSLAILPEMVSALIRSMMPPSWAGETGVSSMALPALFKAPSRSLMTQLAAILPSRPSATASK
ncbi:hypothetical protein D3C80_1992220 [compost metagenome]